MHPYAAAAIPRRHAAAVVLRDVLGPRSTVKYSSGGRISAIELMKMLEPYLGKLVGLQLRPSLTIDPNGVEWEAVDLSGGVISGKLVLRAAVSDSEVISWAEVFIERRPVDPVAERVAAEYIRRRSEGLVPVDDEEGDTDPQRGEGHVW